MLHMPQGRILRCLGVSCHKRVDQFLMLLSLKLMVQQQTLPISVGEQSDVKQSLHFIEQRLNDPDHPLVSGRPGDRNVKVSVVSQELQIVWRTVPKEGAGPQRAKHLLIDMPCGCPCRGRFEKYPKVEDVVRRPATDRSNDVAASRDSVDQPFLAKSRQS